MSNLSAQVKRQAAVLQRKTLRAPFDGVLSIRQVSLGSIVAPGNPIVRLQSLDPIYVDFTVPERHRGQAANRDSGSRSRLRPGRSRYSTAS